MHTQKFDSKAFADLVGAEVIELVVNRAPTKVLSRVGKSLEHFTKAALLEGIDEEMGAIRLIAAEEELVVAIFEWLKLNTRHLPDHKDFIGKQKNHLVKLAFVPVLQQLSYELCTMMKHGVLTFEGLEDVLYWTVAPIVRNGRIALEIRDNKGTFLFDMNPLDFALSLGDETGEVVAEQLHQEFTERVQNARKSTVRQFITERANFRNRLLYAEDGGVASMDDKLCDLIRDVFSPSLRLLLWALATLLTNRPQAKQWGIVSQFIALYRKVLAEAKLI